MCTRYRRGEKQTFGVRFATEGGGAQSPVLARPRALGPVREAFQRGGGANPHMSTRAREVSLSLFRPGNARARRRRSHSFGTPRSRPGPARLMRQGVGVGPSTNARARWPAAHSFGGGLRRPRLWLVRDARATAQVPVGAVSRARRRAVPAGGRPVARRRRPRPSTGPDARWLGGSGCERGS